MEETVLEETMAGTRLEEDETRYSVYVYDEHLNVVEDETALQVMAATMMSLVDKTTSDYIWQKEKFNLRVHKQQTAPHTFLRGCTCVGDCVDDEWLTVSLLLTLSKELPGIVAKVEDSDGEFLLIEAANYLPSWLEPDTAVNRVYIYNGLVHIVPPVSPYQQGDWLDGSLSVTQGLQAVIGSDVDTTANKEVQKAITDRLQSLQSNPSSSMHTTVCFIPAGIALCLRQRPQLVAAAIDCFYHQDPLDVQACKKMNFFPPINSLYQQVTMSRCQYAQLIGQKSFTPPPLFKPPPSSNSRAAKAHDIGAKLACGFEILLARHNLKDEPISPQKDLFTGLQWQTYITSLQHKGFFGGIDKDSGDWRHRMQQAQKLYTETCSLPAEEERKSFHATAARETHHVLCGADLDTFQANYSRPLSTFPPDDPDDWLEVTPQQVDSMVAARGGVGGAATATAGAMANLEAFLTEQESEYDGPEAPGKMQLNPQKFQESIFALLRGSNSDQSERESENGDDVDDLLGLGTDSDESEDATDEGDALAEYMDAMDLELSQAKLGWAGDDADKQDDVNIKTLQNLLESYRSQSGMAGPVGNLLHSLGLELPDDVASDSD